MGRAKEASATARDQKDGLCGECAGTVGVSAREGEWVSRGHSRNSTAAARKDARTSAATPAAKRHDVTRVLHGACRGAARGTRAARLGA